MNFWMLQWMVECCNGCLIYFKIFLVRFNLILNNKNINFPQHSFLSLSSTVHVNVTLKCWMKLCQDLFFQRIINRGHFYSKTFCESELIHDLLESENYYLFTCNRINNRCWCCDSWWRWRWWWDYVVIKRCWNFIRNKLTIKKTNQRFSNEWNHHQRHHHHHQRHIIVIINNNNLISWCTCTMLMRPENVTAET